MKKKLFQVALYAIIVAAKNEKPKIYDMARGEGIIYLSGKIVLGVEENLHDAYKALKRWNRPWNKLRIKLYCYVLNDIYRRNREALFEERSLETCGIRPKDVKYKDYSKPSREFNVVKR